MWSGIRDPSPSRPSAPGPEAWHRRRRPRALCKWSKWGVQTPLMGILRFCHKGKSIGESEGRHECHLIPHKQNRQGLEGINWSTSAGGWTFVCAFIVASCQWGLQRSKGQSSLLRHSIFGHNNETYPIKSSRITHTPLHYSGKPYKTEMKHYNLRV